MLHAFRYVPVRTRNLSDELRCYTSRIVGYRFVCSCGERGPTCKTVKEARTSTVEHVGASLCHGTSSDAR